MKRWIGYLLCLTMVWLGCPLATAQQELSVSAASAVVIDGLSGSVLYEKNADEKRSMASTTKIMTTLVALEQGDLTRTITATKEMVTVEGSGMGLLAGDQITLEGLCYGMMLSSGNDAANTVAISLCGSLSAFGDKMNQTAMRLGMNNTHFVTPSGLDAEHHYSTAYDMAILTRYALQNPTFCKMASASSAVVHYGNPPYRRTLTNHNRLLKEYEGCIGVKTGFTKKSGRCLVSAATRNGATVICVTLAAPDDWNDHKRLLDYGFSRLEQVTFSPEERSVPLVGGECDSLTVTHGALTVWLPKEQSNQRRALWQVYPFLYAPVKKGAQVGNFAVLLDGQPIASTPLLADGQATVYIPPLTFWQRWQKNLRRLLKI